MKTLTNGERAEAAIKLGLTGLKLSEAGVTISDYLIKHKDIDEFKDLMQATDEILESCYKISEVIETLNAEET